MHTQHFEILRHSRHHSGLWPFMRSAVPDVALESFSSSRIVSSVTDSSTIWSEKSSAKNDVFYFNV